MSTDRFEEAVALHRAGRSAEAAALCETVLAASPGHARALHLLGAIRFAGGRAAEGIDLIERAIAAQPDYAEAEFNLGAMLAAGGRTAEAAEHYGRAAALRPDHAEAQARHAAALMNLEQDAAAEVAFRRLIALRPDDPLALIDLATLVLRRGDPREAIDLGRRSVALAPNFAVAHLRLGHALRRNEDDAEAIAEYRQALALDPGSVDTASVLIAALQHNFQLDEAEQLARQTVAVHPDDATAAHDLARVMLAQGDAAALAAHRHAVDLAPDNVNHRRGFLAALLYSSGVPPHERRAHHVAFGTVLAAQARRLPPPANDRDPERRLRIGWLSSDFRSHPVAINLELLFRHFDRSCFEMVGYAHVAQPTMITDWFRQQTVAWRPIVGLSDAQAAEQIRADKIDVMVYLAGRFDHNRPQVAAWRPAPVQVSFHDAATSGLSEMDYLIADPVLVPRRTSEGFTERVVRLPHFSIQPPIPAAPAVTAPPCQTLGYPTFGSFGNPAKLNTRVLALWAAVLRRCPDARLLLRYHRAFGNAGLTERLRRAFGEELMARVDLDVGNRSMADHLDLYRRVDIALDTFPFTGSTTTFEALWMGVPVVTLLGDTMVGRWSAAMLRALKLDELIARTPDEYVEIAVRLAGDPARLAALRAGLREQVARSPLCDGDRLTRHFERLIRALWRRWCRT